jgi:hypothetical protein
VVVDLAALLPSRGALAPEVFSVVPIPGYDGHYVGRDDQGRACVLLGSTDKGTRAPVRLGGLDVQYALTCVVSLDGVETLDTLTVVTSTSAGEHGERYFLHVLATLIGIVGFKPTIAVVAEAVTQLAGIFQKLAVTSRESVTGVIGELVLIASSSDPVAAINGWRCDVDERYDFVAGPLRLEVKSSMARRRVHGFSYEQCDVPTGCRGVLASVFIEKSAGGMTMERLLAHIANRLTHRPTAAFTLEQTLASTLGSGLPEALGFGFDYELAVTSLAFFDLSDIPAIRDQLNPLISQVRFTSDLGEAVTLNPESLLATCPDFAVFKPMH